MEEPPPSLETAAAGFTLIELMIGLAVAALVLTIGVPSFRNIILDNRLTMTEVNTFVADLNLARSEATARNTFVTVKALSGTEWNKGWQSSTRAKLNFANVKLWPTMTRSPKVAPESPSTAWAC